MKKLLLLLCVPLIGFGQKAPPSVLETTNTTFLYAGIDNPVEIGVEGKLNTNLFITFDKGKVSGSNGKYIITPTWDASGRTFPDPNDSTNSRTATSEISIYERVINKDLLGRVIDTTQVKLSTHSILVLEVPPLELYVRGPNSKLENKSTVTKQDLYNGKGLTYSKTDFVEMFDGIKYSIKRFDMYVNSQSGGQESVKKVTSMRQSILSGAVGGDMVIIENIVYSINGKSVKSNSSFSFRIK